jgi:CPA1 family monovalent cation:H+ antiporter
MHPESTLVLLFVAASVVALAAQRFRVPYTVALVLAGLGLGAVKQSMAIHLTKETLYSVFLPGLIFEAAYHLDFAEFRRSVRAIFALAVPGVIVAIGATAWLLVMVSRLPGSVTGFGWREALVFSALIAATDPIAVVALFKSLGAPKRLGVLTEGESLINDGTAIVLFSIIYSAASSTRPLSATESTLELARVAGFGCGVGAGIALLTSQVIKRVDDSMIAITLTMVTAYGSFALADRLQVSGVMSTVTAGMVCGRYAAPHAMCAATCGALESFWEYVAFALNSLVFLLIGLEVHVSVLAASWGPILSAFVAVTLGRAVIVLAVSLILRRSSERIPWRWGVMLTWGGLRGALSMVLALGLPPEFPRRDLLVTMTFGVVLVSILLQGATAGPLLRALGLAGARTPSLLPARAGSES